MPRLFTACLLVALTAWAHTDEPPSSETDPKGDRCLTKEEEDRIARSIADRLLAQNPYFLSTGATIVTLDKVETLTHGERDGDSHTHTGSTGIKLNATVKLPIVGKVGLQSNPWSKIHSDLKTRTAEVSTATTHTVSARLIGPQLRGNDEPWFKDGEILSSKDRPVYVQCSVRQKLEIGKKESKSVGTRDTKEHGAKVKVLIFEWGTKGDFNQQTHATTCSNATEHSVETVWQSDPIRVPESVTVDGVTRRPRRNDVWKFCRPLIEERSRAVQKLQEEFAKDLLVFFDDKSTCSTDEQCRYVPGRQPGDEGVCLPYFDDREGFVLMKCEIRRKRGATCRQGRECRPGEFCQLTADSVVVEEYRGSLTVPVPSTHAWLGTSERLESRYLLRSIRGRVCALPDPDLDVLLADQTETLMTEAEWNAFGKQLSDHRAPEYDKLTDAERSRVLDQATSPQPYTRPKPSLRPCKCRDTFMSIYAAPDGSHPVRSTAWIVGWCEGRRPTPRLKDEVEDRRQRGSPNSLRWNGPECVALSPPGRSEESLVVEKRFGLTLHTKKPPEPD